MLTPSSRTPAAILTAAWTRRGLLACTLWPFSKLFGILSAARRLGYRKRWLDSHAVPVPVIVVGNVFVGGTGKTPFVIWLVAALQRAGFRPGVISRGHGGQLDGVHPVTAASRAHQVGDEPLLMAQRASCPVMVGRDRVAAARALLADDPTIDVIISDDGLQHYRLRRNLEIILFDERGTGNGWLLPAGPLREAASRRRDFTVLNGSRIPAGVPADTHRMTLAGDHAFSLTAPGRSLPLTALPGPVLAAAGIGNPARFFGMLRAHGLLIDTLALPDHHDFLDNPFASADAATILITEKDAVKCAQIEALKNDPRLWVVPVSARIEGALAEHIVEKLRGHSTA